jgi:hypothetical protein
MEQMERRTRALELPHARTREIPLEMVKAGLH